MSQSPAATPKCTVCGDTGEVERLGLLDCAHCDAADQRRALNAFVMANRLETASDLCWMIHQRAVAMMRQSIEITVTVPPQRRESDRRSDQ